MPEISDSDYRQFMRYQNIGTPDEITKKIASLESDNGSQRDTIRELKSKLPEDGQSVVPSEDASLLEKYKELGKPNELKKALEEGAEARKRADTLETRQHATQFARAVGLAEEAVETLVAIPALSGAKFEVRKTTVDDKEQLRGYITLPGEDQKAMAFDAAQEKIPALKGLRVAAASFDDNNQDVDFLPQGGGIGGQSQGSLYDQIREEVKAKQKKAKEQRTMDADGKALEDRLGMVRH